MKGHTQFQPIEPQPPELNLVQVTASKSTIKDGDFESRNFAPGRSGWRISADGTLEAQNGIFNGRFNIGGTQLTIQSTDSIQEALDTVKNAGGGTVFLQDGTYLLTSDIFVPAGTRLEGTARDSVIIDCNTSYKINVVGSDAYNTGTVSINDGDSTVTGSGTTFTSAMVGRYIYLDGRWYLISAFTSTTSIDIDTPYGGDNLAGSTYTIAAINIAANIARITITNATGVGLKIQYTQETFLDDLYIYDCGTGIDIDQAVFPKINLTVDACGVGLDANEMVGFKIDFSAFSGSTTGAGVVLVASGDATIIDTVSERNTGNGFSLTNCSDIAFVSTDSSFNGGIGFELISGNSDIQFISGNPQGNTSDGIKFTATSDRIAVTTSSIINNGGYGVNIAASTDDSNVVTGNVFSGNTSGTIRDLGTGTIRHSNQGVTDCLTVVPNCTPPIDPGATVSVADLSVSTNTQMFVGQCTIPFDIVANSVSFNVETVGTSGTLDVTLFAEDGQKMIFSVTTATISGASIVTTSLSSVMIPAGIYYIAINPNGTAAVTVSVWDTENSFDVTELLYNVTSKPVIQGTVAISAGTPATFTPSSLTYIDNRTLYFRLDN